MERIISAALVALMVVLVFVAAAATWAIVVAGGSLSEGPTPVFFQASRTVLFAIGTLVIVAAVSSVRNRVKAIEAKLDHE